MEKSRMDELKELLKAEPNDSFLQYALALENQSAGNREEACLLLETLLKNDKEYLAAYHPLALLLEQSGQIDKAIKVYEQGIDNAESKNDQHHKDYLQNALSLVLAMRGNTK